MILEEAISMYEERAKYFEEKASDALANQQEYRQLSAWLKELKEYRKPHWKFFTRMQIAKATVYKCSECKNTTRVLDADPMPEKCPHCGAEMTGEPE